MYDLTWKEVQDSRDSRAGYTKVVVQAQRRKGKESPKSKREPWETSSLMGSEELLIVTQITFNSTSVEKITPLSQLQ